MMLNFVWNSTDAQICSLIVALLNGVMLIPILVYSSYQYYRYRNVTMIIKRYPLLTLLGIVCSIGEMIGGILVELSIAQLVPFSSYILPIGILMVVISSVSGLDIIQLRIWMITFDNNFLLAKQSAKWKSIISRNYSNHSNYINTNNNEYDFMASIKIASKIKSNPEWFVTHKLTFGNFNYMCKLFAIKSLIEIFSFIIGWLLMLSKCVFGSMIQNYKLVKLICPFDRSDMC